MKLISIVGDSISTFEGWMLDNYAVYYDKNNATKNGLTNVNDTWWSIVIDYLDGALCVNNSFSGSCVAGKKFPASSSDERCLNLHNDNQEPNIVLIYIVLMIQMFLKILDISLEKKGIKEYWCVQKDFMKLLVILMIP